MKKTISEAQLKNIIAKSTKRVLKEMFSFDNGQGESSKADELFAFVCQKGNELRMMPEDWDEFIQLCQKEKEQYPNG